MQKVFEGEHINDIYLDIIKALSTSPEYIASPRGMEVKEILNARLVLTNPRNCLITLKDRKLNYRFATIEKFEFIAGNHKPSRLLELNPNLAGFVNEYGFFDGHYEQRMHYWLPYIIGLLSTDPDSRQAVINIYGQQDRHKSKDIPCTLTMQFLIREEKLHMIVNMRSNDVLWGVPYDTASFCFIMEVVAASLGVELGTYSLNAGSLHLYTEREEQLTKLLTNTEVNEHKQPEIIAMDFDSIRDALNGFLLTYDEGLPDYDILDQVFPKWLADYAREFKL